MLNHHTGYSLAFKATQDNMWGKRGNIVIMVCVACFVQDNHVPLHLYWPGCRYSSSTHMAPTTQ